MHHWTVSPDESGLSLIEFIKIKLDSSYSNKKIKQALDQHQCKINGKVERFSGILLFKGDLISFTPFNKLFFEPERVLYEDSDILAYNKPPFITSVNENGGGLDEVLKQNYFNLIPVHRLDRETTGVILFAKTQKCREELIQIFKSHEIKKNYLALVSGVPSSKRGTIENYMGEIEKGKGHTRWGVVPKSKGLYSKTEWTIQKKGTISSLLSCWPITGRTHQLRVHFSSIGHPLLGDFKYCMQSNALQQSVTRFMLHANSIEFIHPIKKELLIIKAPLPADFEALLDNLP